MLGPCLCSNTNSDVVFIKRSISVEWVGGGVGEGLTHQSVVEEMKLSIVTQDN